ncbi:NAD-dependent epimerase/dehydratase family protein [Rhodococcus sp. CH91]|uniref:NAD-dependent epimerase/dehydratase family protein n=1 Tax=Rhodococcus sp. CH91 TaxID=2910256 RepID=UPI001F4A766B|nr:NAD-dependent epimerase/dehydratase family protein [Rhodococcus sp. CH91]
MPHLQVVAGAGPVGWTVAEQIAAQGYRVRILTRSGSGPDDRGIERMRVDVNDSEAVAAALVDGEGTPATAVYLCTHGSAYRAETWARELPSAERTVLDAVANLSEKTVVVFPESLYSYSEPHRVMTEDSAREASTGKRGVRRRLLSARAAHRAPTVSVVASDFFGPRVLQAAAGERMVPAVLAGKKVRVLGSADVPHSFTYVPDLAAAMIAAAGDPAVWNTIVHAPTGPALPQREMVAALARAADLPEPSVGVIPSWIVKAGAFVDRDMKEIAEMLYQFTDPFVMDSARTEQVLRLVPTPLDDAAAATVEWWRNR